MSTGKGKERVTIIGTGNYGIAIGKRLLDYGHEIVYGSRNPNQAYLRECFENVKNHELYSVTSIADAWQKSDLFVFFAVSAFDSVYERIVDEVAQSLSSGENKAKILIEISNLTDEQQTSKVKISNVEKLQTLFQAKLEERSINCRIQIVKGFNLTSAALIKQDSHDKQALTVGYSQSVPIAGDDHDANIAVIEFCARIGFKAYEIGSLNSSALKLELANRKTFDDWQ